MSHSIVVFDDKNRIVFQAGNVHKFEIHDEPQRGISAYGSLLPVRKYPPVTRVNLELRQDENGDMYRQSVFDD